MLINFVNQKGTYSVVDMFREDFISRFLGPIFPVETLSFHP
jgi:hypothetical protein